MTVIYFDCFAGASGDMILGALIDAGAPIDSIRNAIERLPIEQVSVNQADVRRGGIRGHLIEVAVPDRASARHYGDIVGLISAAQLSSSVKDLALRTFEILATAESAVHGVPIEDVHFHEVGALDTIIDVVGAASAFEHFSPSSIECSAIPLGGGTVETSHGTLPVPAPAVAEILRDVPVRSGGEGEVITPTGAAILKAACHEFGNVPPMRLRATGYGAGQRDGNTPNLLRVMIGDEIETGGPDHVVLETNLDDMNPEFVPYVIDSLLRAGAQDAWATPITMKKGRPAVTLSALVSAEVRERVVDVLYRETTTLGLRIRPVEKDELLREWIETDVEGHAVRVKIARRGPDVVTVAPEFEDAARVARVTGLALKDVYARATEAARTSLKI